MGNGKGFVFYFICYILIGTLEIIDANKSLFDTLGSSWHIALYFTIIPLVTIISIILFEGAKARWFFGFLASFGLSFLHFYVFANTTTYNFIITEKTLPQIDLSTYLFISGFTFIPTLAILLFLQATKDI